MPRNPTAGWALAKMPSIASSSSHSSSTLPSLAVNHFELLPQNVKNRIYGYVLAGVWTGQSPALIQSLRGSMQYIYALDVMAQVHEFVLSPRNNYKITRMPQKARNLIKSIRIEFKLLEHPSSRFTTFNIFPNGDGILKRSPSFTSTLLPFTRLSHLTLDVSAIPPNEKAWYHLLRTFILKYPKLTKVTLIRDLNKIYKWIDGEVVGIPNLYGDREPPYPSTWDNNYFGKFYYATPRGEIDRLREMTSDHLLIERLNRIFGFRAVLESVNYDDREIWSWNFEPGRYESEEGLTWMQSLLDNSGAWDVNIWWDGDANIREFFAINHYTRYLSGIDLGKVYWIKRGVLEGVKREDLKKLSEEDVGKLLLSPRRSCDRELRMMVETVAGLADPSEVADAAEEESEEQEEVEDEDEDEEKPKLNEVKRMQKKDQSYLDYLGGNAIELDWATGVN